MFACAQTHTHTHIRERERERVCVCVCVCHLQKSKKLLARKEEGNAAFHQGKVQEAYDLYTEALTIDPLNILTNAKLYCNRALVGSKVRCNCTMLLLGSFSRKKVFLLFYCVLSRNNYNNVFHKLRLSLYTLAIVCVEIHYICLPHCLLHLLCLAINVHLSYLIHTQIGKLEESIADCTRAVELDPNYVKAYQRRAKLLVSLSLSLPCFLSVCMCVSLIHTHTHTHISLTLPRSIIL